LKTVIRLKVYCSVFLFVALHVKFPQQQQAQRHESIASSYCYVFKLIYFTTRFNALGLKPGFQPYARNATYATYHVTNSSHVIGHFLVYALLASN